MGREDDDGQTLRAQEEAHRLQALEREIAELRHENAELRGSGPLQGGGGRMMIGKLTKRVRMAFASSVALSVVVLLTLTAGVALATTFTCPYSPCYGNFLADTITGTDSSETIHGLAGIDKIYGLGGNDILYGSEGNDKIYGGEGEDYVEGGEGNDIIDLGPGDDGGYADQRYGGFGGPGNDTINGGDGISLLKGEGGDDKLISGGDGVNHLYGGPGKNTYTGGSDFADYIHANTDKLAGGAPEVIKGGPGNDQIDADDFVSDQIKCGEGDYDYVDSDSLDTVSDDCETVE